MHIYKLKGARKMVDNKSEKFVFIVYDAGTNGYKLYSPISGKTIVK